MRDRVPERLDRLARERAAALVGDGDRHHHRHARAPLLEEPLDREQRGLELSVSKMVSTSSTSTPPSSSAAGLLVVGRFEVDRTWCRARRGCSRPATSTPCGSWARAIRPRSASRSGARPGTRPRLAARDARRGQVDLVGASLEPVVGHRDRRGGEVLVSMMSAPASRYRRWISSMIAGCVSESRSLQPLRSRGWSFELAAAELGLAQLLALDHRAHRAVDDQDAPGQQLAKACLDRLHRDQFSRPAGALRPL